MIKFFKQILLGVIVCLMLLSSAFGQVKFSATIVPEQINKDEYATLRIIVENANDIRKITPPSLKDFIVLSGPNQESGMSNVNGVVTQYIALNYILQPRHSGTILLNGATADIEGKQYATAKLKLQVKNATGSSRQHNATVDPFAMLDPYAPQRPKEDFNDFILKQGERVEDKISKNMFLKLETSKTSCFVGEPVVANYKLYTRLKSESKLTQNPSFNGFSVIDLQDPDVTGYAREKVNGREYNVYSIRKAQLYPLQPGNIELETATLENRVQFLKADAPSLRNNVDGFLNGLLLSPDALINETVSLSSKPVSINVKPLPDAGKPASFKGAVGKFVMKTSLEKNQFSTDETGKLYLVIKGAGNLQLITMPEINWPEALEAFDQKVKEDYIQRDVPVSGDKIFEIPFAVSAAGNYTVPPIEFSYFDPLTAAYKTITTKAIPFSVEKGSRKAIYAAAKKTPDSFSKKMFQNREWIVAFIAFMMITGLFIWVRKEKKKAKVAHKKIAVNENSESKHAIDLIPEIPDQNPLSKSEECLNSTHCDEFYSLLNQELKTFLAHKFSMLLTEVNSKSIATTMDNAGIDNALTLQTQQLMEELEWQLYTPFERNDKMLQLYSSSQSLIQQMNTKQKIKV